jgi:hypothetical protein
MNDLLQLKVITEILDIVAYKTGINHLELTSHKRKREIVTARQCAMWLIKRNLRSITLNEIGNVFGNRHHSTVIHAIGTVEDQLYCNNKNFTWVKKVFLDEEKQFDSDTITGQLHKALKAINLGHIAEARLRIETAIEKLNHDRATGTN